MLNDVASCMQPPLLYVTATSQTQSQSQAHSHCDVTNVMSSAAGRATVSHLAIIVVYIEFAWNYVGFDSNYYFMRLTQLWKSPNYANKSLNYSSVSDSWIPLWTVSIMENWNQDHPDRYGNFYGLYIKFRMCGKWPWTWCGRQKCQGHRPPPQA